MSSSSGTEPREMRWGQAHRTATGTVVLSMNVPSSEVLAGFDHELPLGEVGAFLAGLGAHLETDPLRVDINAPIRILGPVPDYLADLFP